MILVNDNVDEDGLMMIIMSFDDDREGILCVIYFIPGTMSKVKRKRPGKRYRKKVRTIYNFDVMMMMMITTKMMMMLMLVKKS